MGLKIGFGTDLLGHLHSHQTREFLIRREVQSSAAILRSATSVNAEILMEPDLGKNSTGLPGRYIDRGRRSARRHQVLAQDGAA
jgi:hypothetical protein